jgi:hypothetical protein
MKRKLLILMTAFVLTLAVPGFRLAETISYAQTYCSCSVTCQGCQFECTGWDIGRASWKCCKEAAKVTPLECG